MEVKVSGKSPESWFRFQVQPFEFRAFLEIEVTNKIKNQKLYGLTVSLQGRHHSESVAVSAVI